MEGNKLLLIGVWGFPGTWLTEKYHPPSPPSDAKRWGRLFAWETSTPIESHSSLAALAASLSRDWDVHVLVYVLDTLAAPARPDPSSFQKHGDRVGQELAERLGKLIDQFCQEHSVKDYNTIVKRARKVAQLYVNSFFEEVGLGPERVGIEVLPGVGGFSLGASRGSKGCARYVFKGSPQNMLVAMEIKLFGKLLEHRPSAVILDISHGVNYMPVLAKEALRWATRVYSAITGKTIGVAIVNSDPVAGNTPHQDLLVHVVEAKTLARSPLAALATILRPLLRGVEKGGYKPGKIITRDKIPPEVLENIKELENIVKEALSKHLGLARALVAASEYGLALYIATKLYWEDPGELAEAADKVTKALSTVLDRVVIKKVNDTIAISRPYSLDPSIALNTIYVLRLLAETSNRAKRVIRDTLETSTGILFSLDSLRELATEIGIESVGRTLLEKEVSDIEKKARSLAEICSAEAMPPVVYSKVYGIGMDQESKQGKETSDKGDKCSVVDKRNFYAHAGMERNTVIISMRSNRIYVGYNRDYLGCAEKYVDEIELAM